MDEEIPAAPTAADGSDWQGFPGAAAQLAMVGGAIVFFVLGIAGSGIFGWRLLMRGLGQSFPVTVGSLLLISVAFAALGAMLGYLRWKAAAWKLDDNGLQVRRGRWWRKEILVPRSRVQHLDIERGPIERHFGLATLVVHTAGTRLNALRQSGFHDADAVALRDALVPAKGAHDDAL